MRRVRLPLGPSMTLLSALVIAALGAQVSPPPAAPAVSLGEPGIAPDGSTIAFVSGGDIWEVPAQGGDARLLVSHPATESRPMYSPDATRLAFTSTRTGNGDVYVLALKTGEVTRLTYDDAAELVNGWSADSRWIYFSSSSHDLSSMNDVYRVAADGGTPIAVAADRYATEYFAAPSPDSAALAITARGFAGSQWWRKGHSHLDESEIWIVRTATGTPQYEPITTGGAKDEWPMWSREGRTLYFMSDRSGAQNIWAVDAPLSGRKASSTRAVTTFRDGRVLWPSISGDGRTIAFERNFGIWTVDTQSGRAQEVTVALRGAPSATAVEHLTLTDDLDEIALAPDGRKIAFTAHGEVFSASAKDGGDAARLTTTAAVESDLTWAPDSRRLVYASDRDGATHLYLYDFATNRETALTSGVGRDGMPRFSPDGKWVAFERNSRELRAIDIGTRSEKLLALGQFDIPPFDDQRDFDWSPDSKYVAFLTVGARNFQNVEIVAVGGTGQQPESRPASFLANSFAGSVSWSPDGSFLLFRTGQRTEPGQVTRIDLVPRTPKFREDQFRELFKDETPKTPRPSPDDSSTAAPPSQDRTPPKAVDIVFDGIRTRASALSTGLDVAQSCISPDGKWLLLTATAAGQQNLYVYSLDELSRTPAVARQLTSTAGAKRSAQFTPDGKDVIYLDHGAIFDVSLEKREPKPIAVTAELDVDFAREKLEVFRQAWTYLRDGFFDDKMNGVDWAAIRAQYEPRAAGARTRDEVRRVISLMIGELNASHMGIAGPPALQQTSTGRLVADFDSAEYTKSGRLRVADAVPLGPAALAGIAPGDYVLSVDGRTLDAHTNLDELLDHKIGRRVVLGVSAGAGAALREVIVKPANQVTEKGLRYREWVEREREYVKKASGGRLGYVHMYDMSAGALSQLFVDLDVDNHSRDGVVVDVRNNNGGFVNVYAIDVLARRGYFNMARRGLELPPASSRTLLGQRALELPTILVTNQHSLSDAEDFTEGYRSLKLGKVVGEPTAGWIIYTSGVSLIDGSVLRMPMVKIFAADGTPMEMHPRPVDLEVKRGMGESYGGHDTQLDAAVAELLKEIGPKPRTSSARR